MKKRKFSPDEDEMFMYVILGVLAYIFLMLVWGIVRL